MGGRAAALAIAAVVALLCVVLTSAAAALALWQPDIAYLNANTRSRLQADYSPDARGVRFQPLQPAIVAAAQDDGRVLDATPVATPRSVEIIRQPTSTGTATALATTTAVNTPTAQATSTPPAATATAETVTRVSGTPTTEPARTETAAPTKPPPLDTPTFPPKPTETATVPADKPTETPVIKPTNTPTKVPTRTPVIVVPTNTATKVPASTPTRTPVTIATPPSTQTPTATPVPANTVPAFTPSSTSTPTRTPTPTATPTPTFTPTPTPTATSTVTPTPTASTAISTGFQSCSSNAADSGGDGDGYETNPANACADDGVLAHDLNSGTGLLSSCGSATADRHRFFNYGFNVPSGGSTIDGITVRIDASAQAIGLNPMICVELSWDGGSSWTAAKSTPVLTSSEAPYLVGSPTDTWGRGWGHSEFDDPKLVVRITDTSMSVNKDFDLDWVAVNVTYTP